MNNRLYTGGTFDMFHFGHVRFLKMCAQLGDVTVALNTDAFVERYKGKKPVMSYDERKEVLEACKYVSKVVPNEAGEDSTVSITRVHPSIIAIGSDWAQKDYYKQMGFTQKWLDDSGITLVYLPYTDDISSTDLRQRLREYES